MTNITDPRLAALLSRHRPTAQPMRGAVPAMRSAQFLGGNLGGPPQAHGPAGMGGSASLWLDTAYLSLAAAQTWLMPTPQYAACLDHMNAFVVVNFDYFSGSGTLTVNVQSAPVMSTVDAAWQTVGTATVSTTGPQVIKVTRTATTPLTGLLRLSITCNTNAVQATVRADLLLKETCEYKLMEWVRSSYVSFTGAGTLVMPADLWANTEGFLNVFLLVDFAVTSGSAANLAIKLETAPAFSMDSNAWQLVGTALTMTTTPQVYDGRVTVTNPPMGAVRLKYTAAAALAGNLRVQALFKDR